MGGHPAAHTVALQPVVVGRFETDRIILKAGVAEQVPMLPTVVSEIVDFSATARPDLVGVVAASRQTDLGFPVIGTLASRPVKVGDLVAAGQLIAQLGPEELDANRRAAEAGTRLEDATRQLVAAQARLDQAQASRARAADIRSSATLTAPQDGVVIAVFAERGATMGASAPIVRLAGTGALKIVVDLTEQDIAGLNPGSTFDARLAAAAEVTGTATLVRIDPVAAAAASLVLIPISRQIFWGPMAYAMMGGIIVGTVITLAFVPALCLAVIRVSGPARPAQVNAERGLP